ncbi:MAG: HNH endonuclease domain-containing protein, partial [Candidatus Helarchaeota archaeon]
DKSSIIIDDLTYRNLGFFRFWAREVILKAWFDYCINRMPSNLKSYDTNLLYKLLGFTYNLKNQREPTLMRIYRQFYRKINAINCIYTGTCFESDEEFHLDHFLPWSYYPINRFWNLFPCKKEINLEKKDNIPEWNKKIEYNIRKHLQKCIQNKKAALIENDLKYFYFDLQKRFDVDIMERENTRIEKELIEFIKSERIKLLKLVPGKIFRIEKNKKFS